MPFLRGLSLEGAYIRRGFEEGNLGFQIDWTSLIVGRNLLFFVCFTLYFDGNFQEQAPGAGLYLEERFNGGVSGLRVWGFLFGGDCIWKGLFSEFYGRLRAETNCGIAHILGIPTDEHLRHIDIFFNNYDNLQSVHFEYHFYLMVRGPQVYYRFISSGYLVSTLGNKLKSLSYLWFAKLFLLILKESLRRSLTIT